MPFYGPYNQKMAITDSKVTNRVLHSAEFEIFRHLYLSIVILLSIIKSVFSKERLLIN